MTGPGARSSTKTKRAAPSLRGVNKSKPTARQPKLSAALTKQAKIEAPAHSTRRNVILAEMKKGDTAGCIEHMEQAHKALGM
jgi:hypothetical protein